MINLYVIFDLAFSLYRLSCGAVKGTRVKWLFNPE